MSILLNFFCVFFIILIANSRFMKKDNLLENITELNSTILLLGLVLLLNVLWFLITYVLSNYTFILENDINFQIFLLFQWLPIPIDASISVLLFELVSSRNQKGPPSKQVVSTIKSRS